MWTIGARVREKEPTWTIRGGGEVSNLWADPWPEVPGVFIADTPEKCREALKIIEAQEVVGVDVETFGHRQDKEHPKGKAKIISIQFAGLTGPRIFVPMWKTTGGKTEHYLMRDTGKRGKRIRYTVDPQGRTDLLEVFRAWLEDETRTKVLHNAKFDMHALANHGILMKGLLGDTLVMDYLIANGEEKHGLKECIRRYYRRNGAPIAPYTYRDALDYGEVFKEPKPLKRLGKEGEIVYGRSVYKPSLDEVVTTRGGVKRLVEYSVKDPFFTAVLYKHLREKLEARPWVRERCYFDYYEQFEVEYTQCLFEMEREGAPLDMDHLRDVKTRLVGDIEQAEKDFIHEAARLGVKGSVLAELNFNSPKQIAEIFYDHLKIKPPIEDEPRATGKPAMEAIARKRKYEKLANTKSRIASLTTLMKNFVKPLNELGPQLGNKAHTNYKQASVKTLRLASGTQNLQNIPTGKKDDVYMLRKAFIAPPGYVVADIDLSQIEVRLMAHFSKDQVLIDLLLNKWDQHLIAMCILFDEVRDWVGDRDPTSALNEEGEKKFGKAQWSEWRRQAKIFNFSIPYGVGPLGISRQCRISKEEGKAQIGAYFAKFRGLAFSIKRIRRECYQRGYVRTLLMRYIEYPDIRSDDFGLKSQAERQCFNAVVQGSAADILKMGMLLCWKDKRLKKWGVKMILQIHDELVFLIPKNKVEKVKPIIESYISEPYKHMGFKSLVVPTPADLGVGASWMDAKH